MSNDMKLIYENYRAGNLLEDVGLFERHEYIEHALGFKPLLNESGGPYYTEEMKKQIIKENNFLQSFIDKFNPIKAIKKYGKEVGQLFSTLYSVIKNPKLIPAYIKAAEAKVLKKWKLKIEKAQKFLISKNMPTFAKGLQGAVDAIKSIMNTAASWKKAISVTGVIIGIAYLFEKLTEKGADIFGGSPSDKLSAAVLEAVEKFLMKEFPAIMIKLYAKASGFAQSASFGAFVAVAAQVVSVINLAKDSLKPLFANFELRKKRAADREATARDGRLRYNEELGNLEETFRKNLGVIK